MRIRLGLALAALLVLFASTARATVGGPEELSVVGYDPGDSKVYLLRHYGDESGRLPQLEYVLLSGPNKGRRIEAKSWHFGETEEAAFHDRLAQLTKRLVELQRPTALTFTLSQQRLRPIAVREPGPDMPTWKGWQLELTVTHGKRSARKRVKSFRDPANIVGAWRVPDRGWIVLVRYVGIPFELGYERDEVIWLPNR